MAAMTKERLRKLRRMLRERKRIAEQMESVRSKLMSPAGGRMDGMPRSSSGENQLEAITEKLIRLEEIYNAQLDEILNEMLEVEKAIAALEPDEQAVIRLRYLREMKWEDVAEKMRYSLQHVHRIHGQALYKLERKTE